MLFLAHAVDIPCLRRTFRWSHRAAVRPLHRHLDASFEIANDHSQLRVANSIAPCKRKRFTANLENSAAQIVAFSAGKPSLFARVQQCRVNGSQQPVVPGHQYLDA